MTHHRSVWYDILYTKIVKRRIPTPGTSSFSLSSASAREIEEVAIRAIVLRQNWSSPRPQIQAHVSFSLDEVEPISYYEDLTLPESPTVESMSYDEDQTPSESSSTPLTCLTLYFLPGRDHKYLVVILRHEQNESLTPTQRLYEIQFWDISVTDEQLRDVDRNGLVTEYSRCIARHSCSGLMSACVNADPKHPACLIITRQVELGIEEVASFALSIDFEALDPFRNTEMFQSYSSFPSYKMAVGLQGCHFFATDDSFQIRVINIDTGHILYVLATAQMDPPVISEEYRCLNSLILDDFVLIFRERWIHLYPLRLKSSSVDHNAQVVFPLASHKWIGRLDTIDVTAERCHPLETQFVRLDNGGEPEDIAAPLVRILIRFASMFPWPVNILHLYILPPNPSFNMNERTSDEGSGNHLPYLSPSSDNAPAEPSVAPYLVTSLSSAVRIFTPSDSAIGPYGTVMWLDAQTDLLNVAQVGDRGQRVAGALFNDDPRSRSVQAARPLRHSLDSVQELAPGSIADRIWSHVRGQQTRRSEMVFHVQEHDDNWVKIGMCEDEGMIAIGELEGQVSVYKYI
ncbi:hypothetical protein BDW22DRAFT_1345110 [Trametopsis cervina]|nr:hypothetical protein BDW22DRAFT_1345110 [Trametopsis cervina]